MRTRTLLITLLFLAVATLAQAGQVGFEGFFDPGFWTVENTAGGLVDTSGAPGSIVIIGGDAGISGQTAWYITVPSASSVFFDWSYETTDWDPSFDPAGYMAPKPVLLQLTNNSGSKTQSGSVSFALNAGQSFGFYVRTTDGAVGPGRLTISNFEVVPEPATLLLVGAPLVIAALRRRKSRNDV